MFALLPFLGACSDVPPRLPCAKGALSSSRSVKILADELYRERRLIVALDVALDGKALMLRDCEEIENCVELDVTERSGTSPANLLIRLLQRRGDAPQTIPSGIYLSEVNEATDSTHFIELTQLTPAFPVQVDKTLCLDVSAGRQ
jgi:hypothetical protein